MTLARLPRFLGKRTEAVKPPGSPLAAICRDLEHGALIGDELTAALVREMTGRAEAMGVGPRWPLPQLSELRVRRDGLPETWAADGNLFLAGPGAAEVRPGPWMQGLQMTNSLIVLGAHVRLHRTTMTGDGALIVLGDHANLHAGTLNVLGRSAILIGEKTSATFDAQLDARNGGGILVGADGMWAHGVRFMTDDMHAIRDQKTGERLNRFGGRIAIEPHVWLGEHVQVMGGSRIGADSVVGIGSLVKGALPGNCICVGRPARPVRRGVTWSREDVA
jgi:acetyltransferase-like isoleucine patch superfamily enzyme